MNLFKLLSSLQVGYQNKKLEIQVPKSLYTLNILKLLLEEGYILNFKAHLSSISIQLHYPIDVKTKCYRPAIKEIKVISAPGRRIYLSCQDLRNSKQNLGLLVLSTSKGIMSLNKALEYNLGGEILCTIS